MIKTTSDKPVVTADILREAQERCKKRNKEEFDTFLASKYTKVSNFMLDNLPSISGLPLSTFLIRLISSNPVGRYKEPSIDRALEVRIEKLISNDDIPLDRLNSARIESLTFIRCALQDPEHKEAATRYMQKVGETFNRGLATCLMSNHRELSQEACFTLCVVARCIRFNIYPGIFDVITGLVRIMALSLSCWESYVETYRDIKERHADLEIARGHTMHLHFARVEIPYTEVNHRIVAIIYFTLADLIFNCPSPKLLHYFECRIFRRKEITRTILFSILHVAVSCLAELKTEANRLTQQDGLMQSSASRGKRHRVNSFTLWHDLPAYLYSDIVRVYKDRNRTNKTLIVEIMSMLRNNAPEKLPLFEEALLKVMELYGGGGGGNRFADTYQISAGRVQQHHSGVSMLPHGSVDELPGGSTSKLISIASQNAESNSQQNGIDGLANSLTVVTIDGVTGESGKSVTQGGSMSATPAFTIAGIFGPTGGETSAEKDTNLENYVEDEQVVSNESSDMMSDSSMQMNLQNRRSVVAPKLLELFNKHRIKPRLNK